MNCRTAREAILVADTADLEGRRETALAAHIRGCARCRADAHRVLAEQRALDRALASLGSAPPAREASGTIRRLVPWAWVPVATAAGIAALVVLDQRRDHPRDVVERAPIRRAVNGFALTAPSDRGVAVLEGSDPSVLVVWFYEPSGEETP